MRKWRVIVFLTHTYHPPAADDAAVIRKQSTRNDRVQPKWPISYALGVLWVSGTTTACCDVGAAARRIRSSREPCHGQQPCQPAGCAGTNGPRGIHHTIRLTAGMTAIGGGVWLITGCRLERAAGPTRAQGPVAAEVIVVAAELADGLECPSFIRNPGRISSARRMCQTRESEAA
jgi:hypothetical protein